MYALKKIESFPHAQADRCVMCGLCLPHCPTYRKTGDENESPRGRIALMRALAHGDLPLDDRLEGHLARCTSCGACESVCPSYVGYTETLYAARAIIHANSPASPLRRWGRHIVLDRLLTTRGGLASMKRLLRIYRTSGLQRWLRARGVLQWMRLGKWEGLLPAIPDRPPTAAPNRRRTGAYRGKVALFTGCVASVVDAATLDDTVAVLRRLGYEVEVPENQTCCGALHLHAGQPDRAAALMRLNVQAFGDPEFAAVIGVASGCTAVLAEYPRHLADDSATAFARKVQDVNQFLAQAPWPDDMSLRPLAATVAVHEPCTLRNALRAQAHPYSLLRKIPQLQIVALPENKFCCGGAGTYMLDQPAMADSLRADKLAQVRAINPSFLATCNIGCALHLGAGLRADGAAAEVLHPVTLVARQLPD